MKRRNQVNHHKTIDQLRAAITSKSNGRIVLLDEERVGKHEELHLACTCCGTTFTRKYSDFMRLRSGDQGCPTCRATQRPVTSKYRPEEIHELLAAAGYRLEGEYRNVSSKVTLSCGNPQHPAYTTTLDKFLSGARCPYCRENRISFAMIKQFTEDPERLVTHGARFRLLTTEAEFESASKTMLTIASETCSHEPFTRSWSSFANRQAPAGCPKCADEQAGSWGAGLVANLLTAAGLAYTVQATCPGLVSPESGYPLRLDFFIPATGTYLEIDGIQHFKVSQFGSQTLAEAQACFARNRRYDELKDAYFAATEGVTLVRLPLYDEEGQRPYAKTVVIERAMALVSGLYEQVHGAGITFATSVLAFDQGGVAYARDKVARDTVGKVSFVDDRYFGVKGWHYRLQCQVEPAHGEFEGLLDSTPPQCPVCKNQKLREQFQYSRAEIADLLQEKHGGRITLADAEYRNTTELHVFRCRDHGDYQASLATVIKTKSGSCPGCNPGRAFSKGTRIGPELTPAHFRGCIVPAFAGEEQYSLLTTVEEYGGVTTPLRIRHSECGETFTMRWAAWKSGSRCPHCRPARPAHNRKSEEEVRVLVAAVHGGSYELLEPYQGMLVSHSLRCKATGQVFHATIDNFLRGKFRKPLLAGNCTPENSAHSRAPGVSSPGTASTGIGP